MKVGITGVAGFIGSNLASRLLKEGYSVVGIDNLYSGFMENVPDGVVFTQADVRDNDLQRFFKGCDAIVHLAADSSIRHCEECPMAAYEVNVLGTENILEVVKCLGIPRLIYAESAALYEGTSVFPTPESERAPKSYYGQTKAFAHDMVQSWQEIHGIKAVGLRYANVYGPNQDFRRPVPNVMISFMRSLKLGQQPIIYGTGKKRRDFIYVDDVNDFHMLVLKDDRALNQVFNVGSGEWHDIIGIYRAIATLMRSLVEPNYGSNLDCEAEMTQLDITKAESLGWKPKTLLNDGLRSLLKYVERAV